MSNNEQIGKDKRWVMFSRQSLRWIKKQTAKLRRRLWKQKGEDAPTKGYKGWAG